MRTLLVPVLLVSACAAELDLGSEQAAINSGFTAQPWMYQRAADPGLHCSGTLVDRRFALTALHCIRDDTEGSTVQFFFDADSLFDGATVAAVHIPPGTDLDGDSIDFLGRRADIALLELEADAPGTALAASLAYRYPGAEAPATVVGNGTHDDQPNLDGDLRFVIDNLFSSSDSSGQFSTFDENANPGDSGGAVYHGLRLLGVIMTRRSATSVSQHLPWILGEIDWQWPHLPVQVGVMRIGDSLTSFGGSELRCQYACATESACSAYNYSGSSCQLLTGPTAAFTSALYRSDVKP